jgi:hypothetical protein
MRSYRAGDTVEQLCRACKIDRLHTVIATDSAGRPVRVQCDYCGSQHNSRGGSERPASAPQPHADGGRTQTVHAAVRPNPSRPAFLRASDLAADGSDRQRADQPTSEQPPGRLIHERMPDAERQADGTLAGSPDLAHEVGSSRDGDASAISLTERDLERILRRVIREESGLTPVEPAERWRGGALVLRSANADLQEKVWPVDVFFHKVVMIRNRLRTLEQQVNAMDIPEDAKLRLQTYITGCYGTLTSFNLLFADEQDCFRGTGG